MRYEQIKPLLDEEILDEVKMSPSALKKFANSPEAEGMLMGIEFEMCVPNVAVDDDSGEGEYDYDYDERAYSIDDIVNFFRNGDMATLSRSGADQLRNEMWDQFLDWQMGAISDNLDTDELADRIRDRLREDVDWEDYLDDAREELGDEVPDSDVEDRARELADEKVDDMMQNSREYEDAYDDIRQEMEDEMRDDSDYDEQAWLRDIGIDFMSEAEREWSLDWPHWRSYGGDGELDVETVGDEFGRAMGLEFVNTSNNYHGARRDGKNWIIEPDSSIDADEGDGGLEFVSPPMPIKDGLEMIQKMYKWAKSNGCYTNRSTGLHMNISVPDMTIDKLDYVKLALFLGDEYVLKQFGREYNSYCKSAISKIKDRVRPEDVPAVLAQMKQHLNSLASKTIHTGITDKYTSINTKSNYVEFRGPGGDYLDRDPFEIINTALRLSMALRIATDPEAYKQEYAKKLYKLVEQEKDPDNSVKLFSQYAVGELPKEDLLARLKFAKKERELEKTKKGGIERLMNDPAVKQKVSEMPTTWQAMLGKVFDFDTQEIQSTINNIEDGAYDSELTAEQKKVAIAILQNELDYRKETGEKKSYWVMNRDGSGGKQMVFARNENEAILQGGKNMGLSREQSITRLKAELKTEKLNLDEVSPDEYANMLRALPTYTLEKFVAEIGERGRGTLETALRNVKAREVTGGVTEENYEFLEAVIERELKRRDEQGEPGTSEVPEGYGTRKVYPRETSNLPSTFPAVYRDLAIQIPWKDLTVLQANRRVAIEGQLDNDLNTAQKNLFVSLIDDELAYRTSSGEDSAPFGVELQFVAAPSTAVPGYGSRKTYTSGVKDLINSLPNWSFQDWVMNIPSKDMSTLRQTKEKALQGRYDNELTSQQKNLLISLIEDEIIYRASHEDDKAPIGTMLQFQGGQQAQAQEQPQDELPSQWEEWLTTLSAHNMATLATVQASLADTSSANARSLNAAQRQSLISRIEQEIQRRDAASTQAQTEEWPRPWDVWIRSLELHDMANLRNVRASMTLPPNDPAARGITLSNAQRSQIVGMIDNEIVRRTEDNVQAGLAAQQNQLRRDDPVTSNDPDSQAHEPEPQPVPGQGSESFEIYNPETMEIVASVQQGTMDYAVQKAREHEQDLGLDAGTLRVRSAGQTNESINTLRRLAGLK